MDTLFTKILNHYILLEDAAEGEYKYYVNKGVIMFKEFSSDRTVDNLTYELLKILSDFNMIGIKSKLNTDDVGVLIFLLTSAICKNKYFSAEDIKMLSNDKEGLDQTEDISYWIRAIKNIVSLFSDIKSYDERPKVEYDVMIPDNDDDDNMTPDYDINERENIDMEQLPLKANQINLNIRLHKQVSVIYI